VICSVDISFELVGGVFEFCSRHGCLLCDIIKKITKNCTQCSVTWEFLPFVHVVFYFVSCVLLPVLSFLACNCCWLIVCIVVVVPYVLLLVVLCILLLVVLCVLLLVVLCVLLLVVLSVWL